MQALKSCVQRLSLVGKLAVNEQKTFFGVVKKTCAASSNIHTSSVRNVMIEEEKIDRGFIGYNNNIYPVQGPDEERRPAFVCHGKKNVRYSPKKMWYVACFVRGMSVDEALKQLDFVLKKGGAIVKETILEAQQMAVEKHNVEFKSNLWVAESFSVKGIVIKGLRRHARARAGEVRYTFSNYYVRLEEGKPPKDYYQPAPKNKDELLNDWLDKMHTRSIKYSL